MSGGWNTIESDAGVFTYLLENLGVKDVQFEELISLDADLLRQLEPVYGLIFLFRYPTQPQNASPAAKAKSTERDGTLDHPAAENLFFASQTIQNACGTQALLSVLLNHDKTAEGNEGIEIGEPLREFKGFVEGFPAELRGEALSNSELIRDVHNSFARSSPFVDEQQRLATEDDDVYHFIAYASLHNTLYELDGLQPAPISHGPCSPSEFPDKIIPVLQKRINRYPENEIRFNVLAMVRDLRIRAMEIGDVEALRAEEGKRRGWRWENALRRANMVGFVGETLKGVAKGKIRTGGYEGWVEGAKGRTRKRYEERKKGGGEGEEMEVGA